MNYIIQESIKELKLHNAKKRENYIEKLLDYYNGNYTAQYISKMFSATVFNEIPLTEVNITRRFINKMSRIYTIGANRNAGSRYDELTVLKSTRMKHIILSVEGDREKKTIREFVDNRLLAIDARALREYIRSIQPDINMEFDVEYDDGHIQEDVSIPITVQFFWPDAEL